MSIDQQTLLAVTNAAANLTSPILIGFSQGAREAAFALGEKGKGQGVKGEVMKLVP